MPITPSCQVDILNIISDQSLADISWLLSVLWHYSYQNDQSLGYFQQAFWNKHGESSLNLNIHGGTSTCKSALMQTLKIVLVAVHQSL